jgi:hypothetical protein
MFRRRLASAVLWIVLGCLADRAGANAAEHPLAVLPSEPGPHLAKIETLGEDCWAELGSPAPDPKWGTARGRSWTPEMVYVIKGKLGLWAFDVEANEWKKVEGEGQPDDFGGSNHGTLSYDPAGDALVWHRKGGAGIRIYDIRKNRWRAAAPPPKVDWKYKQLHGFYDPELSAHFYYLAGDGEPNGFVLCYRYKRR